MKVEEFLGYVDRVNRDGSLDWLRSMVEANSGKTHEKVRSFNMLFAGKRDIDGGLVIGYLTESGGLLDVEMLADWYCCEKRDVLLSDIVQLRELGIEHSYEPIRKSSNTGKSVARG